MAHQARRGNAWRVLLLASGLASTSTVCDRGYDFHPVEWTPCEVTVRGVTAMDWCFENQDLRVSLNPPGGLVGSSGLSPELQMENLSRLETVLLAPQLFSKGRQFEGIYIGEVHEWRLEPGTTDSVDIFFELGEPMRDALGETARISLPYRVGEGPAKHVHIDLRRSPPYRPPRAIRRVFPE